MPFVSFTLGQQFAYPGEFLRVVNVGPPGTPPLTTGVVAVLMQADQGPLNAPTAIFDELTLQSIFGAASATSGVQVAINALRAGAPQLLVTRVGSGGTAAVFTFHLADGTTGAFTVPLASVGTNGNAFTATIRDSLYNTAQREFVLYQGTAQVLDIPFAKAPTTVGGHGEPGAAVAAINAYSGVGSYLGTAALVGTPADNSTLQAVANLAPGTAGTDPTVNNASYTAGMTTIQTWPWNFLITDSTDQSLAASLAAYIATLRNNGNFVYGIVGEPTTVPRATREADALAYNAPWIVYVGNGYTDLANGATQGANAVGSLAGIVAGSDYNANLAGAVVPFALPGQNTLLDPLVNPSDWTTAENSGMLVFGVKPNGQIKVFDLISTFVTPNAQYHQGFKYLQTTRIVDHLMSEISATWDELANLQNNPTGRGTVIQVGQRVLTQMVADGSLENDGQAQIIEDPTNPPQGVSAWFQITANVVYGLEKIYLTALFQYAPNPQ